MRTIYFDCNATTFMPALAKDALMRWTDSGNPSSNNMVSAPAVTMLDQFRSYLIDLCRIDHESWDVIFTSCASEANCTIISSTIQTWVATRGNARIPHIVCSSIEHSSILTHISYLVTNWLAAVTFVEPTSSGHITPASIKSCIRENTCLIICMHANNETGAINDVASIGAIAHHHNIPFHCDVVQSFGKCPTNLPLIKATSIAISPHKFGGPTGVGILIAKRQQPAIVPLIWGSQNGGLRGGTENVPGLGASFYALRLAMHDRARKNERMCKLKNRLVWRLSQLRPIISYPNYVANSEQVTNAIVLLSMPNAHYLCNTLLISVVNKSAAQPVCNVELKKELQAMNVVVGIGSACNTKSKKASHVVQAMGADRWIKAGVMRLSLGDRTQKIEIDRFVQIFNIVLTKCMV